MNEILTGDCLEHLARLPAASVDLAFADPPFNIGYDYDVYNDRRGRDDYLVWTEKWLAAVEASGAGLEETTAIDRETAIEEMLMMGLRLVEGVSRAKLESLAGRDAETFFSRNLEPLIDGGFLTLDAKRLTATTAGRAPKRKPRRPHRKSRRGQESFSLSFGSSPRW